MPLDAPPVSGPVPLSADEATTLAAAFKRSVTRSGSVSSP